MTPIYKFLSKHNIPYERVDHPPVYTVAEALEHVPPLDAAETKNLLVRDRKGKRHFLVVVGYDKQVDLKALAKMIGVSKLGMASPERLMNHLGVEPGSVTLLGIVNDEAGAVEIIIDEQVWAAERLKCHPLVNTSTLAIWRSDMEKIFHITGHEFVVLDVPGLTF
ncbi:MAG: prolyl-tRNA synthetase associated domain-containing protein [Ardenticatenaceae bacterium]|nr:prolyl-tRNA synthetase associated domain-containing protein [Ardenticatenaceae bacterium]